MKSDEMSIKMKFSDGSSLEYVMTDVEVDSLNSGVEWALGSGYKLWLMAKAGRVLKTIRGRNNSIAMGVDFNPFDVTSGGS